jgi:hypothetical protein
MSSEFVRAAWRRRIQLLLVVLAVIAIALTLLQAQGPLQLQSDVPGIALVGKRLMIALPISNDSTLTATNVNVTEVSLPPAQLISPAAFPVALGGISPDERLVFQSDFDSAGLAHNTLYVLTVTGTYQVNGVTFNFTLSHSISLPPPTPGSAPTQAGTAPAESLSGAPFPPGTLTFPPDADTPGPPVPTGPAVPGTPTQQSTLGQPQVGSVGAVHPSVSSVAINANYAFGNLDSFNNDGEKAGDPGEPTGGSNAGGVVFVSFNWGAAYSTGGGTFNILNPLTMFPQPPKAPYGFCCDQVVQYVSKIDRFVWLQQLTENGGGTPGAYRLAAASPAGIKKYNGLTSAWTSWILRPEEMGWPHATQFDRPGMSVGNNYLYIGWDNACPKSPPPGCIAGRAVIRVPLSQIQLGGSSLSFRYLIDPSFDANAWGNDFTQDTGDQAFWAGQNGTSSLNVYSWSESSTSINVSGDVPLTKWVVNLAGCLTNTGKICSSPGHHPSAAPSPILGGETTPATTDWLFRSSAQWVTGTRKGNSIWFAWNSAPHDNFPQPYIEMVEIDTAGFTKVQQVEIWNPAFAFGLPSLATNQCTGEIGLSLAYGGGGSYPNHAVGFWGDYLVYPTTSGDVTAANYGDYVSIRRNYTPSLYGAFFDAFGYALTKVGSAGGKVLQPDQVNVTVHYVVFGRPGACAPK